MIQAKEVSAFAAKTGVGGIQIEKDYVISWILYGIAKNTFLKQNLIFKGGTALKKVYFPNYRFSENLDFAYTGFFNIETIRPAFAEIIERVYEASGIPLTVKNDVRHEAGNFNFYISYVGPLGGSGVGKEIRVDISIDELIYHKPQEQGIINPYTDLINEKYGMLCYTLDEIAAEKMRLLMQRTAPRDIYDLWYLFEMDGYVIEDCMFAFQEKSKIKNCDPNKLIEIIEKKEGAFAKHWRDHLSRQMKMLPEFPKVWRELGKYWRRFQKFM